MTRIFVRTPLRLLLRTPPIARVVPEGVFDAFGWCASSTLEWGSAGGVSAEGRAKDAGGGDGDEVTGDNPPGMAFVFKGPCDFLPMELARLHAPRMNLTNEWALAPYAIDDATDLLYERKVTPRDLMWLATDTLSGLVWGLHDWSHFHNHGPFVLRAWTELQCDAAALAWLWLNREAAGVSDEAWERARAAIAKVAKGRFEDEGIAWDEGRLAADRLRALVT